MENIYWSGVIVSFPITIISSIIHIRELCSLRAKNMSKVAMVYSLFQAQYVPGESPTFFGRTFVLIIFIIGNTAASWLNVIWTIYGWASSLMKKFSTPEKIKEIQFRISNTVMDEHGMRNAFSDMSAILGIPEEEGDNERNELILDKGDGYVFELEIFPSKKICTTYFHTPDYDTEETSTYEYKIKGNLASWRLREKKIEHPGQKYHSVKDGVVLKSEINSDSKLFQDSEIEHNESEIMWNSAFSKEIRNFILARGSTEDNYPKIRTFFRKEIERIKDAGKRVNELNERFEISDSEKFSTFSDEYKEAILNLRDNEGIDLNEVHNSKEAIATIEKYISEIS